MPAPDADPYAYLESALAAWAQPRRDLLAGVVVGSRARADHPADAWSDLDLVIFTTDPAAYAADATWLARFGEVWLTRIEHHPDGSPEWFALYADALKLDILFSAVPRPDARCGARVLMDASTHREVFARGARILFDKGDPHLPSTRPPGLLDTRRTPAADEFAGLVSRFLFDASRAVKMAQRRELWQAQDSLHAMRGALLTLLEWHSRAARGLDDEIWYDGRFLSDWADPRTLAALPSTFAAYSAADVRRALAAQLGLFRRLSAETAQRLALPDPTATYNRVAAWLVETFLGE